MEYGILLFTLFITLFPPNFFTYSSGVATQNSFGIDTRLLRISNPLPDIECLKLQVKLGNIIQRTTIIGKPGMHANNFRSDCSSDLRLFVACKINTLKQN